MAVTLGGEPAIKAETKRCVAFDVDDPRAFAKSIGVISKLIDEACFKFRGGDKPSVVLQQIDPSHVALVTFEIGGADLFELKEGDKLCLSTEKLTKILGRLRKDDERVGLSATDGRVMVKFPTTDREFSLERIDVEQSEIPEPNLNFTAKARVLTRELKSVLKDADEASGDVSHVKLRANDGVVLSMESDKGGYLKRFKDRSGLVSYEAREPSEAQYDRTYLEHMTATEFDVATLEWGKEIPLRFSYNPMPHSRLEFLLAPRVESE